jgi:hypothetical protein
MEGLERSGWNPARQCTAVAKQTGERCQRQPVPGAEVCVVHGGAAPQVQAVAKRRLLALVEPVLDVFEEVVNAWRRTTCATCGFPTGDVAPVIRVGQLVLDRSGFHPTLTVEHAPPVVDKFEGLSDDELVAALDEKIATLTTLRNSIARSQEFARHRCGVDDVDGGPLVEGAVDAVDGFIVPDDDVPEATVAPIQNDAVQFPQGNETPDPSKEAK